MRNDYTHIVIVLDGSGSMMDLAKDTRGGLNSFIAEHKKAPGEATLTLVQFNSELKHIYENTKIASVKPLNERSYIPMGTTALLKAVEDTIDSTGRFLSGLPEHARPGKVIFVIITDGEENSSGMDASNVPYSKARVNTKINHQRDRYNWEFVFLGANQDALKEGQSLGVTMDNSMNYGASSVGITRLYSTLSDKSMGMRVNSSVTGSRVVGSMAFTSAEKLFNDPNSTTVASTTSV